MKEKNIEVIGNIYTGGVYCFFTKDTNMPVYVGCSFKEINDALSRHKSNLKTGKYWTTNKVILQKEYERNNLVFKVMEECTTVEELEKAEKKYINLYKDICNVQNGTKWSSSNKNKMSTWKRRSSNMGENNPNSYHDPVMVANVLWLKLYSNVRNTDIAKLYGLTDSYVSRIGVDRWVNLKPIMPEWYIDIEKEIAVSPNTESLVI